MEIKMHIDKLTEEIYQKVVSERQSMNSKQDFNTDFKSISQNLASVIDHTLLKPEATAEQIKKLCLEAKEYKFASVCVNSSYIPLVADMLRESGVKACSVIGFPLGACSSKTKVAEAKEAIEKGALEIDMVINVGALKSGNLDLVNEDIESVVSIAKGKALVKVIIETCLLTDKEKITACLIAKMAGANFVKTSTGFSTGGAKIEDVKLMRMTVGQNIGVKASGGIKSYETAVAMIKAGANRLGTSSGIVILKGM
jgi:deoxyribose-phosphate aldolase